MLMWHFRGSERATPVPPEEAGSGTLATRTQTEDLSRAAGAMQGASLRRNLSVEDIMGSLTKMNSAGGGAFPRTDSEQAFQEFLKRIPSSNSLAAFGSHGSQLDTAAQGLQFSTIQQVANQVGAYSQPPASAPHADGGGSALLGVPRVASLDFFRQLLPVNQLNFAGSRPAAVAEENEESAEAGAGGAAGQVPAVKAEISGAFQPPPTFIAGLPPIPAVLSSGLAAAAVVRRAAEAVQPQGTMRTSSTTSGGGNTSSQPGGGSGRYGSLRATADGPAKDGTKAELRRARRMLSNRESARRSRRRKQEHLGELETKIQQLQDEKEDLQEELEAAQKECAAERASSAVLRRQFEQLKAHVMRGSGVSAAAEVAPEAEAPPAAAPPAAAAAQPVGGQNGSSEWGGAERRLPRVSSFPRVASAENLPSRKRLADGEAPPLANGHRRKRTPQAADV